MVLILAGVTQGQSFKITGLTACVTYTVSVELSYAYTFEKDKMSIEVNTKCSYSYRHMCCCCADLILVVIVAVVIILCIWKLRGKNDKKLQSLTNDENESKEKKKVDSNRDFEYAQKLPPTDKLANNPVLTKPSPKFNQSAVSKSHCDDVQLSHINRRMPNCTTVVQTASDLLNSKFDQIRPKNDTFRPFIRLKKLPKSFGIVQLIREIKNTQNYHQILIT